MLTEYREHVAKRAAEGVPPAPLSASQVKALCALFAAPPAGEESFLLDLLSNRVPAGVDEAAEVKAAFLADVATGKQKTPLLTRERATELLGTMLGGFNVAPLVTLLDDKDLGALAAKQLSHTLLVFGSFDDVAAKAKAGNANAKAVLDSWAKAEWFTSRPKVKDKITVTVFKIVGETNTDDLAGHRGVVAPDIPRQRDAQGAARRHRARAQVDELEKKARTARLRWATWSAATGSSRKSATNSGPLVHGRHPARAEQALGRPRYGRADRADLLLA
ncbi:MAG: hypothetical protein U0235_08360 [Polyangiaceae bacterium]